MRLALVILLTVNVSLTFAQVHDGLYKSSNDSYRKNFFLNIQGESMVLYGWESVPTNVKDTIYFKTETKLGDMSRATFQDFQFSRTPITIHSLESKFIPGKDVSLPIFLLHRYINVTSYNQVSMEVQMTKDAYDSKFDEFVFVRVR